MKGRNESFGIVWELPGKKNVPVLDKEV